MQFDLPKGYLFMCTLFCFHGNNASNTVTWCQYVTYSPCLMDYVMWIAELSAQRDCVHSELDIRPARLRLVGCSRHSSERNVIAEHSCQEEHFMNR